MKKQSFQDQVWLGFDIKADSGPLLRPRQIRFWKEADFKNHEPEAPFHYFSDALVGLSLVHLNQHLKTPFAGPKMNYSFCHEAWLALEPHHELYSRSQPRVQALRHHLKESEATTGLTQYFERNFSETLEESIRPWGVDLTHLAHLIEAIDYLETKMEQPLLYNFNLKFAKSTLEKLHYLHSMLFNLRSLIAMDYNAHCQDPTHEACKVDSITDYLSKADYVSNDALLYYHFKKLHSEMKADAFHSMDKQFRSYSHNGVCLIESLPKSFLSSMNTEELEGALYIVQMDWLLGTDAGLLFRVREELYGLVDGYEKIFWPDHNLRFEQKTTQSNLSVNCQLDLETLYPSHKAA